MLLHIVCLLDWLLPFGVVLQNTGSPRIEVHICQIGSSQNNRFLPRYTIMMKYSVKIRKNRLDFSKTQSTKIVQFKMTDVYLPRCIQNQSIENSQNRLNLTKTSSTKNQFQVDTLQLHSVCCLWQESLFFASAYVNNSFICNYGCSFTNYNT